MFRIHTGSNADLDPAYQAKSDRDSDLDPNPDPNPWKKKLKKYTEQMKKIITIPYLFNQKLQLHISRSLKRTSELQEKQSALQNSFAILDPDPDPTDQTQCGSGSATLLFLQISLRILKNILKVDDESAQFPISAELNHSSFSMRVYQVPVPYVSNRVVHNFARGLEKEYGHC